MKARRRTTKPIVFICHSSKDERMVKKLKELLSQKVGNTIELFASSDGQSIPLGRNWVREIEEALVDSKIVFVLLSPNSIRSNWIYFEAGFAYSKGIKVIPIGVQGIDLYQVPPPLSLLQGFNINSLESLDNLISILNREFNYTLDARFTGEEYAKVFSIQKRETTNVFKEYTDLIYEIGAEVPAGIDNPIEAIANYFRSQNVEHKSDAGMVDTYGLSVSKMEGMLSFKMGQQSIDSTLRLLSDMIRLVQGSSFQFYPLTIEFMPSVNCTQQKHQISSRIIGTDIRIIDNFNFGYSDIVFRVDRRYVYTGTTAVISGSSYSLGVLPVPSSYGYEVGDVYLEIKYYGKSLTEIPLYGLLTRLFELRILF